MTTSGQMKEFQAYKKVKVACVASAGTLAGMRILDKNLQTRCAVNQRGFFDFLREGDEVLAHQESAIGGENPGDNQRCKAICPADEHHQLIKRHDQHHEGDHDRAQIEHKDRVPPGEVQAGKGISADYGCGKLAKHDQNGDKGSIGQARSKPRNSITSL